MLKVVWDYEANRTLRRQRRKIAIETYTNQYTTEYFVHKKSYLQPAATENVIGWIPPTIGWHQINKSERMEWRLAPSIHMHTDTNTHQYIHAELWKISLTSLLMYTLLQCDFEFFPRCLSDRWTNELMCTIQSIHGQFLTLSKKEAHPSFNMNDVDVATKRGTHSTN